MCLVHWIRSVSLLSFSIINSKKIIIHFVLYNNINNNILLRWGAEKKNQVDFYNRRFVGAELPVNICNSIILF